MLSVNNMLNEKAMYTQYKRPAVLDISNLLCSDNTATTEEVYNKSPSLSPSLTSSPASVSSYTSYPFPTQVPNDHHHHHHHSSIWEDVKKHKLGLSKPISYHRDPTPISQPSSVASSIMGDQEVDELEEEEDENNTTVTPMEEVLDNEDAASNTMSSDDDDEDNHHRSSTLKAKRRRANATQLEVLNRVFDRTFFPSTQMRAELGRQLGMSPRTVQIWFQNRRQAMRTRERQRLIRMRNDNKANTAKPTTD